MLPWPPGPRWQQLRAGQRALAGSCLLCKHCPVAFLLQALALAVGPAATVMLSGPALLNLGWGLEVMPEIFSFFYFSYIRSFVDC